MARGAGRPISPLGRSGHARVDNLRSAQGYSLTLTLTLILWHNRSVLFSPISRRIYIMMIADDTQQSFYTIEQVATRTGLTKRTLRYYEEVGLLPPTGRTEGNYRRYSEFDIQRLERIKELRGLLGFSLNEIRKLLEAEDERGQIKVAYRHE